MLASLTALMSVILLNHLLHRLQAMQFALSFGQLSFQIEKLPFSSTPPDHNSCNHRYNHLFYRNFLSGTQRLISRNFSQSHQRSIARQCILLVGMVLAVCLWQRAGLSSTCPINADHIASGFMSSLDSGIQQDIPEAVDTECELSNHLIQAQLQLIEPGALLVPLLLLILAWLRTGNRITLPFLTEPILPRRRHHLVLCVFQE